VCQLACCRSKSLPLQATSPSVRARCFGSLRGGKLPIVRLALAAHKRSVPSGHAEGSGTAVTDSLGHPGLSRTRIVTAPVRHWHEG
jgi:hypothetical protein